MGLARVWLLRVVVLASAMWCAAAQGIEMEFLIDEPADAGFFDASVLPAGVEELREDVVVPLERTDWLLATATVELDADFFGASAAEARSMLLLLGLEGARVLDARVEDVRATPWLVVMATVRLVGARVIVDAGGGLLLFFNGTAALQAARDVGGTARVADWGAPELTDVALNSAALLARAAAEAADGVCVLYDPRTNATQNTTSSFCLVAAADGWCAVCAPGYSLFLSANGSSSVCAACPAGTFAEEGGGGCVPCAPGWTTLGLRGRSRCFPCPAGTVADANASLCVACPPWSVAPAEATVACTCVAGATPPFAGSSNASLAAFVGAFGAEGGGCAPCAIGLYKAAQGPDACTPCDTRVATTGAEGATACDVCVPGARVVASAALGSEGGAAVCTACAGGTYSSARAATACTTCAPGSYAAAAGAGATACAACAYQPAAGATTCAYCPDAMQPTGDGVTCTCAPGFVFDYAGTRCAACFAGFFKAAAGSGGCALCPPFYTTAGDGQSACAQCAAGAVRVPDGSCAPCGPGYYQPSLGSSQGGACLQCAPGTFAPGQGATACQACAAGSFAGHSAAAACAPCPPFSAAGEAGSPRCACQSGWILDASTQACVPCPQGYVQLDTGGCKPCPLGAYAAVLGDGSVDCRPCPVGAYAATIGALACTPCPLYMTTTAPGAQGCVCLPGARVDFAHADCVPCPAGSSVTGASGASGAASCIQCPAGTYSGAPMASACSDCPAGTDAPFAGQTACVDCALWVTPDRTACQCPPGTFNATAPRGNNNGAAPSGGNNGSSSSSAQSADDNLECSPCTAMCTLPGTFLAAPCTHAADIQCAPCATAACAAGTYLLAECTPLADRVCWPCRTGCPAGFYIAAACTPLRDIQCRACHAACARGQYLRAPCAASADRDCAACPAGAYSPGGDAGACTPCPDGAVVAPTRDACVACPAYAYAGACVDACPPGAYPATPRGCAPCPDGSYNPLPGGACVGCGACVSPARDACGAAFCAGASGGAPGVCATPSASAA